VNEDAMDSSNENAEEALRLQSLLAYGVLDTPPEEAFDDLTRLAARFCRAPIALIGFIDQRRYWAKSKLGLPITDLPRAHSFSNQAILQSEILVIEDASKDPRFARLPVVTSEPFIRFYAGVPLISPRGGYVVGTLSVLDRKPRKLSRTQAEALRILGHQVVTHLELRRNLVELERSVSNHLRAEAALRRTEENYRSIFENVLEGIYQTTPDGHYLSANPMLAKIYGYHSAEELMTAIQDIQHQIYLKQNRRDDFVRLIQRDGTVSRFESQVYRKDGSIIWISESARAVKDPSGKVLYYEGTVEDITERKRAEDALQESELLYHSLVECLPQNIFRKDTQGRFTFANTRFCEVIGRSRAEIVGKTDFDFFPADLARKYQEDDRCVMEARKVFETVEEHQSPDRGPIFVQVVKTPLYDADGNVIGVQGIFWDVTERKKMEEALAYERDLLRALLDNIPDGIYFKDRQSRFLRVGRVLAQKFGLADPGGAVGRTDFDFFSGEHAGAAFEDEQEIIRSGQPVIGKIEKETWPGRRDSWVLTTKMPLRNEAGEIIGTFGISKDITALKEAEQALAQARDAALDAARLKAEFLANMSHEIRTPMNCIIGMSGLLLDTGLNEEQRDFTETIRSSADSLLIIINDVLDFSKMEAGKLAMELIEFDLWETVESTIELLAERADAKGIELVSWIHADVPRFLQGDPSRVRQVLTNLVGNAIKFTDRGEVVVRLTRQSKDGEAVVHCAVNDTGIGVPPEVRSKLFQSFTQVDGSLTRRYGGTGLGLAISKQLVEMMGGEIGMTSTLGQGSTFWFTVRLHLSRLPPGPTAEVAPFAGRRMLIVDDNATTRQLLNYHAENWKMVAATAGTPEEALGLLRAGAEGGCPFDVVVLDLQMPGMDSLSLAQQIRSTPQMRDTRLLMLTSLGLHLDAEAWHRVGIDAYLVKPIKVLRLRECLAAIFEERTPGTGAARGGKPGSSLLEIQPQHLRILVAEDNLVNQRIALRQLKKLGYSADAVADGKEAVEAVKRIPYDLVLMDCQMPELDGYEATRRIRRFEAADSGPDEPPVYVIAMTANAMEGDREGCLAAGMNDYVSKPVKLPELQAALHRAVGRVQPRAKPPPPSTERGPTEPLIDPAVFEPLRSLGEPGEANPLAELLTLFMKDTPRRLESIKAAVLASNAVALREAAHSLKGTASNLGARRLARLCARVETLAKADQVPEAAQLLPQVVDEYRQVCFVLEQEQERIKSGPALSEAASPQPAKPKANEQAPESGSPDR
jgi:two-component system, sensor histidine kinase and response regulator